MGMDQLTNNYCENRIRRAKQPVQCTPFASVDAFRDQDQVSVMIFDYVPMTRLVRCRGLGCFSGNRANTCSNALTGYTTKNCLHLNRTKTKRNNITSVSKHLDLKNDSE